MNDPITPEIFNHLVELAALQLDPVEGEYIRGQLNNQLKSIRELEAIPLDDALAPALHGVPYPAEVSAAPRADVWQPCQDTEAILSQAPQFEDGYIIVPDIPHTTLE